MKLTATMTTAQEPNQQSLSSTDRRHRFICLPVDSIAARHTLVFFVNSPVNIFHMMVSYENSALFGRAIGRLTLSQSTVDQQRLRRTPSPDISSSVERIPQDVSHQALGGDLPNQTCSTDRVRRQFYIVITEPL